MDKVVGLPVAMAILVGGESWPLPPETALVCAHCGRAAAYLREIAGSPAAAWTLTCAAHKGSSSEHPTHLIPTALLDQAVGQSGTGGAGSGITRDGEREPFGGQAEDPEAVPVPDFLVSPNSAHER
jgi:hypothetical protein